MPPLVRPGKAGDRDGTVKLWDAAPPPDADPDGAVPAGCRVPTGYELTPRFGELRTAT
jgi:hypothetical protein